MHFRCEFIDNYDHLNSAFEYIIENEVYAFDGTESHKKLLDTFKLVLQNKCACISECLANLCEHGTNYIVENQNKILNKNRPCLDIIYECGSLCSCELNCINRLVQFGPAENLKIYQFNKGFSQYGLITLENLVEGQFLCEYAGEILTKEEALRRSNANDDANQMNYIICLNEISNMDGSGVIQTFIDPSRKGNIGRYINHSCDPNCITISIRTDSVIPKIGIFAKRAINSNEELTFDYGSENDQILESDHKRKLCFCNSEKCRKYLPNNKF